MKGKKRKSPSTIHHLLTTIQGFTLIEVLITIAIIGILSTIGISTYQSAQKKGRDINRKASLSSVVKALESYMNDYGEYPKSLDGKILWCGGGTEACEWGDPLSTLIGTDEAGNEESTVYMAALPKDPATNQQYYYEEVLMDGKVKGYRLYAKLENSNDPDKTGPYDPPCSTSGTDPNCNYVLASDTVAAPSACLAAHSSCSSEGDTSCCNPIACVKQYKINLLGYYSEQSCPPHYFCGPQSGYTEDQGIADMKSCTDSKECCSGECNTYYKTGSCTAETFCGSTPPEGYGTSPSCCIASGGACPVGGLSCCTGGTCCNETCCNETCCNETCLTPKADGSSCTSNCECTSGYCTPFYVDHDLDGYGAGSAVKKCGTTPPSGYAINNTDCNDTGTASQYVYISKTCYYDVDQDGYGRASYDTCMSSSTCGYMWGSGVEGTTAHLDYYSANNTDCNDGSAINSQYVYSSATCYVDADNDNYGSTTSKACVGKTDYGSVTCATATYGSEASHGAAVTGPTNFATNTTDCNDTGVNSKNVSTSATCYTDYDNDEYGNRGRLKNCINAGATCATATWASPAEGEEAISGTFSANNTDCKDNNASVKPPQTAYFTTPMLTPTGTPYPAYDYNCDKAETKQYLTRWTCTDVPKFVCTPGFAGISAPACGNTFSYCPDCTVLCNAKDCSNKTQGCH